MAKTNTGNFFEDFEVGSELVHAVPRTITEGDASVYIGLTGSRYPLHCSAEFVSILSSVPPQITERERETKTYV